MNNRHLVEISKWRSIFEGGIYVKKRIGIIVIGLGLLLLIVSLAPDALGIGNRMGIGGKQILGAVVGALVAAGGVWWGWGKPYLKK